MASDMPFFGAESFEKPFLAVGRRNLTWGFNLHSAALRDSFCQVQGAVNLIHREKTLGVLTRSSGRDDGRENDFVDIVFFSLFYKGWNLGNVISLQNGVKVERRIDGVLEVLNASHGLSVGAFPSNVIVTFLAGGIERNLYLVDIKLAQLAGDGFRGHGRIGGEADFNAFGVGVLDDFETVTPTERLSSSKSELKNTQISHLIQQILHFQNGQFSRARLTGIGPTVFAGKITVAGGLKEDLNGSGQNIESRLGVIDRSALKDTVFKEPDGRAKLNKRVERLSRRCIGHSLVNVVQTLAKGGFKNLRSFVVESDIVAILAVKYQTPEVLAPGYKRGYCRISCYRQGY